MGQNTTYVEWHGFDALRIRATVKEGQVVLLQETYDPEWGAYENGKRLPVSQERPMSFMLIDTGPGTHTIEMRFDIRTVAALVPAGRRGSDRCRCPVAARSASQSSRVRLWHFGQCRLRYPYGEGVAGSDSLAFGTYTRDSYTALDYADQRFYASTYGRFNTADQYTASGGPGDPGSWNRYSYTEGDPVNRFEDQFDRFVDGEDVPYVPLAVIDRIVEKADRAEQALREGRPH
jgi:RHS repeat-associated protein